MRYRVLLFSILLLGSIAPSATLAQLDSRCWTQSECEDARARQASGDRQQAGEGFVQNNETEKACGGKTNVEQAQVGFCLPVGKTVTQIAFGGKKEFLHLGEYIQYMYQYGIIIAGLLATLMIIAAGFEWLTSGGNAERISSAQKRIANSLMGLFLAVMSYVILVTINPYLTTLRLPQVWLINQQNSIPVVCSSLQTGTKISLARQQDETLDQAGLESRLQKAQNTIGAFQEMSTSNIAECKNEYFVEKAGAQTCRGTTCPRSGQVCAPMAQNLNKYDCYTGSIAGVIYNAETLATIADNLTYNLFGEQWVYPWADEGETELWGICTNGKTFVYPATDVTTNDDQKRIQSYFIRLQDTNIEDYVAKSDACGALGNFKGFVLNLEMNESLDLTDEDHFVGSNGEVDLGDTPHFNTSKRVSLPANAFISLNDLKNGYILNINAGKLQDYD